MASTKGEWIKKSELSALERRQNSTNGNPRYWATFGDGSRFGTVRDGQVGYTIDNFLNRGPVVVYVVNGEVQDIDTDTRP